MSKLIKVGILISGKLSRTVKRSTDAAVKSQGRVGSALRKVSSQLGQARQARKYGRLLNDLKKKQRALGHSSERLDRGIEEVERRYNEARRAASRYGSEIGDIERKTRRLGDTQKRQGGRFSKGQVGAAVGAVGGAAISAGVIGAGRREEEGLYLGTVINARDGDKDAAVARSRSRARALVSGREVLAGEAEIINIEYALNSAGLQEDVARAGSVMVHKVAKITKGQGGLVSEVIATAFNNLGDQMVGTAEEKMTRIGNILTKTQFDYQIRDFNQLGASMEYAASAAAGQKVSLVQTAAVIGQLNTVGLQGSRAGTAFSAMMRNMTKAGGELGFSMRRGADGSLDLIGTLEDLNSSLDGLGIDERSDLLGKIFGEEGKAAIVPILRDIEKLKNGHKKLEIAAQSDLVNEEYEKFLKTALGIWRTVKLTVGQTAVSIGTKLLPVVSVVGKAFAAVMGWVSWGVDNIPGLGLAIGLVGAVIVGTATAMGVATAATWAWNIALHATTNQKILGFVGMLTQGLWGLAVRAFPAVIVGVRALGIALLTNPVGLIITGIAVGALLLMKFWKPVSAFFGRVFAGIKASALAAWSFFKDLFKWSPIGLAIRTWKALPDVFKAVLTRVKGIVLAGMAYVGDALAKPVKMIKGLWDRIRGVRREAAGVKVGDSLKGTKVGAAVNDNFKSANDNANMDTRVVPGAAYAALNGTRPGNPAPPRPPLQPPLMAAAGAVTTHHVRQGDTNTYVFHGVLDGEEAVRKLEPHLQRRDQENREADLHD